MNIPPDISFVDCLARYLLDQYGDDLNAFGQVTILTTTRRAARALQNAFLRETKGKPLLLPRMRPLGDVDEDDLILGGDAALPGDSPDMLGLPPAIGSLRRQLLLSRLIQQRDPDGLDLSQCAGLARELARLLDQVHTESLDFADLKDLVPDEYAAHWQKTLEFLTVISDVWPTLMEAEGSLDPAKRRDLLIRAQVEAWQKEPPTHPVYAVGSTGSIPSTAELLSLVSRLPQGCVILPGLDRYLDDDSWEHVKREPGHPQYGLSRLLDRMGISRDEVGDIIRETARSCPPSRPAFLSNAMRPAETTDQWQQAGPLEAEAFDGVELMTCPGPQAEALVIALLMRETLESPRKTAVLITPDRDLSRRVSAELKRWDIEVDDSAGSSLDQSPPGVFLRLTAKMMASEADPVQLLAMLKHPYATMGLERSAVRRFVRLLEIRALRGPRPAPGLDGIRAVLDNRATRKTLPEGLMEWFDQMSELAREFETLSRQPDVDFRTFLIAHIRFAERLSQRHGEEQPHLWQGHFGEAAASFVSDLLQAADVMEGINPKSWPELLDNLMSGQMVRARYGMHPRLQIWGPIEGRLQRADLVIMGGLNDGIWPPEAASDPWMSRPMRKDFHLPVPEKKIGLSAHDFQQAFCAKQVVLTRSEKVDGTPMVPSRWLLRIETLLKKFGTGLETPVGAPYVQWQARLDQPAAYQPVAAPRPTPPVSARPRRLSVTRIEKWMKDPYSIFASSILELNPLDAIGENPGAADKGTIIHKALEDFIRAYPDTLPADAVDRLLEFGREAFADLLAFPAVWGFWWPRFERIADWFVAFEQERRSRFKPAVLEQKGTMRLAAPYADFVLSGTADRIDRSPLGELSILDYKTGYPPSVKEVDTGIAPQLALEAAMIKAGAFSDVPPGEVTELAYIRLSGGSPAGEFRQASKKKSAEELSVEALDGLNRLIAQFDREATPYLTRPRPDFVDRFNDYEHLARIREWSSGDGDDG
nr:double-strand break repair protein AddB [Sneathiella chinensis]